MIVFDDSCCCLHLSARRTTRTMEQSTDESDCELDSFLVAERDRLSTPHKQRSTRVVGTWTLVRPLVKVTAPKGKHWQVFGFSEKETLYLQPEEALYLNEIGVLEVEKEDGSKVPCQELYGLVIRHRLSLEEYQVYSMLTKSGYVVHLRHIPVCNVSVKWSPAPLQVAETTGPVEGDASRDMTKVSVAAAGDTAAASPHEFHPPDKKMLLMEVFLRSKHFKKTSPGVPHCYVMVVSVTSPFPTGGQIQSYIASLPQEAPLNFAVVDGGGVSMFCVAQGHIPDLTLMQQAKKPGSKDGGRPCGASSN